MQFLHNLLLVIAFCTLAPAAGCVAPEYAKFRDVPRSPLVDRLKLTADGGNPSDRTMQLLRKYDLASELDAKPDILLTRFGQFLGARPSSEQLYSMAELSFLAGKKTELNDEKLALDHYETAVAYAYLYLFDEGFGEPRNPYDPHFRGACDLYNGALESSLRIVKKQGDLLPGRQHTIESASRKIDVTVVLAGNGWSGDEFERFEFVSDYEIQGLTNQYQTFGLGVPLIAIRKRRDPQAPIERHYPPDLAQPVTAFLRVIPQQPGQPQRAFLELYNPLTTTDITVANRRVTLESDLSTPLAYFLNDPRLNRLATVGLLRPDKSQDLSGLYMFQPYEPGKIPVIMVHGLWSSPITWVEMLNDLRSHPELRQTYQFWFYLYPTGEPFWNSAIRMRADLAQIRATLDPWHQQPALDHMVLVGHSMGGLVSKMQTVFSGNDYWKIVSDQPFHAVKATPETRQRLEGMFFFQPNPAIDRVITIGTPHRGSSFASATVRWLSHKLIYLPKMSVLTREQVVRDNKELIRDPRLLTVKTSLDSLAPDSPILPVLLNSKPPPGVKYHNVVGVLPQERWLSRLSGRGDGVVPYESAHLGDVASELEVNADHSTVHRHPLAVLEVQRILLDHLHELRNRRPAGESDRLPQIYPTSATAPLAVRPPLRPPEQMPAAGQ